MSNRYKMACVTIKDSDQPAYKSCFCHLMMQQQKCSYKIQALSVPYLNDGKSKFSVYSWSL